MQRSYREGGGFKKRRRRDEIRSFAFSKVRSVRFDCYTTDVAGG